MSTEKNIEQALKLVREEISLAWSQDASAEETMKRLADQIDRLITTDFNLLLSILYRVDVGEEVLKAALAGLNTHETAGQVIARLIVKRMQQKLITKKQYREQ